MRNLNGRPICFLVFGSFGPTAGLRLVSVLGP
jgi:hypothetical protein